MSRSSKGSKGPGFDYWTPRPGNESGGRPGRVAKTHTHRVERQQARRLVNKELREI